VQRCWVGNVCMYVWERGVDVQTQTLWLGAESRVQVHCVVWACGNSIREAVSWLGYLTPVFPRQSRQRKLYKEVVYMQPCSSSVAQPVEEFGREVTDDNRRACAQNALHALLGHSAQVKDACCSARVDHSKLA
jgi:hypothetical protein